MGLLLGILFGFVLFFVATIMFVRLIAAFLGYVGLSFNISIPYFMYFEFFPKHLSRNDVEILNKYFTYYKKLSPRLKKSFEKRVARVLRAKTFHPREDLEITNEMRVLISASLVQLTFGLAKYVIKPFKDIFIYPDKYTSVITKKGNLGEVNPNGAVVFSWKHFLAGYVDPNDNINLGLHEFSHALLIASQRLMFNDKRFDKYFGNWEEDGMSDFIALRKGTEKYFREYGGTNKLEYFAVCCEYFFETPEQFKKLKPKLYRSMVLVLGQDPLKIGLSQQQKILD
ncbi:MAG: Mlc titration factor MtfA (ptsG expression regulator) [Sphingobacteriales bacterium]|jgi:Mlc titration factor MtfA (ptsG expression regulator)